MAAKTKAGKSGSKWDLVLKRTFRAPRSLVFGAWIDPKHLGEWWGPRGFTNRIHKFEARAGGEILLDMCGPEGSVYPMSGTFREIVPMERIVLATAALDASGKALFEVLNTAEFADHAEGTELTLTLQVGAVTGTADQYLKGMKQGWGMSLDRLGEHLGAHPEFVITRVFDAPRDLVFGAWVDAGQVAQWFGPKGCKVHVVRFEPRPGGIAHMSMRMPDGKLMWGKWVFREIAAPSRIVFVNSFSDEKEGITRHPFMPQWPLEMLSTTTFDELGKKTRLTVRWRPLNPTEAEQKTFDSSKESMTMGWTGTLEQLESHLSARS